MQGVKYKCDPLKYFTSQENVSEAFDTKLWMPELKMVELKKSNLQAMQ